MSRKFVCVRTYVGLRETTEMLSKYGIVGDGKGKKGPWTQGNNLDYVFFTPNLKALSNDLVEMQPGPEPEEQDKVRWRYTVLRKMDEKEEARLVTGVMKKILEMYPPKGDTLATPWQLNSATAFWFASYEDRRIVLVPAAKGVVDPALLSVLGDQTLLRKHVHNYVFLKLPPEGVPPELTAAVKEVGDTGFLILERPQDVQEGWKAATLLKKVPGPLTAEAALGNLDAHVRPAGYDSEQAADKNGK